MNLIKSLTLLSCLFLVRHTILAQSSNVRVSITAVSVMSTEDVGGESPDYRWNIWFNQTNAASCIALDNKSPNIWYNVNFPVITNQSIDLSTDIGLEAESWEEDSHFECGNLSSCGQGNCTYNSGCLCDDDLHMTRRLGVIENGRDAGKSTFKLINYEPGNHNNLITINYGGGKWSVEYKVTYTIPTPLAPKILVEGANYSGDKLCNEKNVTLSTGTAINPDFNSSVKYVWEYIIDNETRIVWVPNPAYCGDTPGMCDGGTAPLIQSAKTGSNKRTGQVLANSVLPPPGGGLPPCCYEPPFLEEEQQVWRTLGSTMASDVDNGSITFDVRTLYSLSTIKENVPVNFRVKAVANGLTSVYSSSSNTLNVSPVAPVIGGISTDPSCPNYNSGIVHVSSISGVGEYRYVFKAGFDNNAPCNPDKDGSCLTGSYSGTGTGTSFDINNITSGNYTFWLANPGGIKGSCYATQNVTLDRIPDLSIHLALLSQVTCNGDNSGSILLDKSGGIAPYSFTLTGIGTNSSGEFSSLPVGTYTANITDGCSQTNAETLKTITIKQPTKVSESLFNAKNATCINPGNGELTSIVSKSTGEYDTLVSNTFLYRLFKDNALYTSWESSNPEWTRGALPVGNNYQLIVTEKGSQDCNGYTKTFAIEAPEPLSTTNLIINSITCFGGTDGMVTFDGIGGSDLFTFKLSKTAGDTLTNALGSFTDMRAGDYTLVIENDLPGCFDQVSYPDFIRLSQPDSIAISLAKSNITCFGYNDGNISSSVSGGTPGYSYSWEEFIGSSWSTINAGSASLSNLPAGTYRLRITDSKSCPDFSSTVSVIEPAPIDITSTIIHDIKCLGEKGSLEVVSTGGTIPYTYEYSLDNGSTFTAFTGTTLLDAGNYVVKTIDKNGCTFTDPGNYLITTPLSALDFTGIQSDYNGFDISCFGGSNGFIILTPTGGNGATYSGYQFALDGGNFQQMNTLNNINAGTHTISVIDARGCIVSKDTLFTQTSEFLSVQTVNKLDVVCYGDLAGSIEVQGSGGLSPYLFKIGSSSPQSSAQFSNLGDGSYIIEVTDLNGCSATLTETIEALNPRIQFQPTITNVSCFEGTDGSIVLNVVGGVQPFTFNWVGQSSNTSELVHLGAGTYAVTMIDNAGCKRDSSFTVSQPTKALSISSAITPVCYGKSNGVITINATGGTTPYQYSVDGGLSFQRDNLFNTVGVGTYSLKILDDKGCTTGSIAEIIQRNDRPEPNFLVATRQNALDTLIITEISVPKPDSIDWIYDPSAVVIIDNEWAPQIKFYEAGTYFVSMTGYFGGCDYSVTKNLTLQPYDPNTTLPKDPGYGAIQFVEVSPNPSSGDFDVTVKLSKKYNVSIMVYDMIGVTHYGNHWNQIQEIKQKITLPQASAGVYLVRIISDTDAKDVRLILNR